MFFQFARSVSFPHSKKHSSNKFFAPFTKTTVSFRVCSHFVKASVRHVENSWQKANVLARSCRTLCCCSEKLWSSCQACSPPLSLVAFKLSSNLEVGTTLVTSDSGKVRSVVRSVVPGPGTERYTWQSMSRQTPLLFYSVFMFVLQKSLSPNVQEQR